MIGCLRDENSESGTPFPQLSCVLGVNGKKVAGYFATVVNCSIVAVVVVMVCVRACVRACVFACIDPGPCRTRS